VDPTIKITARQIRFLLVGRVWMIQPLHIAEGVPKHLQGFYCVPLAEQRRYQWGLLNEAEELQILESWIASGFGLNR